MRIILNISDKIIEEYKKEWFSHSSNPDKEILEDIACIVAERIDCMYELDKNSKNMINYK